jgi:hypothetical protein
MVKFLKKNDWARLEYQEIKHELVHKGNQHKKLYAQFKELNINNSIDRLIEKEKTKAQHTMSFNDSSSKSKKSS